MANTYNTDKSAYETKKTAYNKALADEKARKADFFKAMFELAVEIPERPCQPTRPEAFSGLDFTYTTTAARSTAEKAADSAVFTQNDGVQDKSASFKLGYQAASDDATAFAAGAGHTYGLLGQGTANFADTAKAFQWATALEGKAHYMMVSILPYAPTETALGSATADVISVTFAARAFGTSFAAIAKPSRPAATTAPDAVSAKALAASVVALAAVAASLF